MIRSILAPSFGIILKLMDWQTDKSTDSREERERELAYALITKDERLNYYLGRQMYSKELGDRSL